MDIPRREAWVFALNLLFHLVESCYDFTAEGCSAIAHPLIRLVFGHGVVKGKLLVHFDVS